jgi:hypothetical protein
MWPTRFRLGTEKYNLTLLAVVISITWAERELQQLART